MTDELFIQLPIELGRRDDHLSPSERAFADALAKFPPDRLRVIFEEASSSQAFRAALHEIVGDEG